MTPLKRQSDSVHWFLSELGARVVAESGIPSDRHHLGKLILRSLKDAPDFVMQIDAIKGKSETYKSVLDKTVRCAESFKNSGLKTGDVIVIMSPINNDVTIPFYAALYLGVAVAPVDANLEMLELASTFKNSQPKMIFCINDRVPVIKDALKSINLESEIISFDDTSYCLTFSQLMTNEMAKKTTVKVDAEIFKAEEFNPSETPAMLVCTSGTTGLPKAASLSHKNLMISLPYYWTCFSDYPTPTQMALVASPLHWLSASAHFVFSPILRYTRLQVSQPLTQELFRDLVNNYKPTHTVMSPTLLISLLKPCNGQACDISCFTTMQIGGSAVPEKLHEDVKKLSPNTRMLALYGLSEIGGVALFDDQPAPGSLGRPIGTMDYRLVDIETREDIREPNVKGELWLRGPSICKGYYNNPEATKEAFEEGGWLRSGDIFYRDENNFFYFVDRLKLLLKYRSYQISPAELEDIIRQHPGVFDVAVTGIPDPECGDLAVACVVPKTGSKPTAQEIKDLVKNSLTDSKQLRGGVVFINELPMTTSTKVHRRKLKEMVLTMERE